MKKIDKLLLGAFVGPFIMTFLVVVFILLTQHMLKYFDDIIGKGLGGEVIGQLLFYFAIFMTPVALPLAVLLSSLIAFGNLGEHFELTAIKSSGISLVRALRPIFFFVIFLTFVAFYANNNVVPKAALEAYSLLYDIKQKKPALDLREGAFYNGINRISIKVNKKYEDGITIKDVVVYDHRNQDGNKEVTIADSGKMYTILNERYLKFELFNGYNYSEGATMQKEVGKGKSRTESMSRSKFDKSQIVFDLSDLDLKPTDKKWFQGNRIMRNLSQLESDMDSIDREILGQRLTYYQFAPARFSYFHKSDTIELPRELKDHQKYRDSINAMRFPRPSYMPPVDTSSHKTEAKPDTSIKTVLAPETRIINTPPAKRAEKTSRPFKRDKNSSILAKRKDTVSMRGEYMKRNLAAKSQVKNKKIQPTRDKKVLADSGRTVNYDSMVAARVDSLFNLPARRDHYSGATNAARQVNTNVQNTNASATTYRQEMINFEIQWHKILASSLACIAMFLIGAPLGAIIKKGGLGMPFLVSIIFFIVYYVLTMQGEKLAKGGTVSPAFGVWMADAILFVIGLLFLRQARADARLFEADFYSVLVDRLKKWFGRQRRTHTQLAR